MTHHIILSDDELATLDQILGEELDSARGELRHAQSPEFREYIQHRMETAERVMKNIKRAETEAEFRVM